MLLLFCCYYCCYYCCYWCCCCCCFFLNDVVDGWDTAEVVVVKPGKPDHNLGRGMLVLGKKTIAGNFLQALLLGLSLPSTDVKLRMICFFFNGLFVIVGWCYRRRRGTEDVVVAGPGKPDQNLGQELLFLRRDYSKIISSKRLRFGLSPPNADKS